MQLDQLGLDRNLYRDPGDSPSYVNADWEKYLSADNPSQTGVVDTQNPLGQGPGAPGTTVSQAIMQSSGSSSRISVTPDDIMRVYCSSNTDDGIGIVVTGIDLSPLGFPYHAGISLFDPCYISTPKLTAEEIDVIGSISLQNDPAWPAIFLEGNFSGFVTGAGVLTSGSVNDISSWSVVRAGPGSYIITTGLGLAAPYLNMFVNAQTPGYTISAETLDGSNFGVNIYDSTFTPADSDFNFMVFPL